MSILLIVFGYVAFDKLTPKLDFDELLNKGNVALAIVAGFIHSGPVLRDRPRRGSHFGGLESK